MKKMSLVISIGSAVKVKKGNVIRAIAKLSDGTFTDVVRGTYFVGLDKKRLYGDHLYHH